MFIQAARDGSWSCCFTAWLHLPAEDSSPGHWTVGVPLPPGAGGKGQPAWLCLSPTPASPTGHLWGGPCLACGSEHDGAKETKADPGPHARGRGLATLLAGPGPGLHPAASKPQFLPLG